MKNENRNKELYLVERGKATYIALGSRLKGIPEVRTLGVKPNFTDYNREERALIQHSKNER